MSAGRVRWAAICAVVAVASVFASTACAPPPGATGLDPDTAPRANEPAYAAAGPYDVGVTTIQLSDRPMEVWYPVHPGTNDGKPFDEYRIRGFVSSFFNDLLDPSVDPVFTTAAVRDLPVADGGPFPLVLFAHGFASFRLQSSNLTSHLASWGFVVISPDFLDRGLRSILGEPPAVARSDLDVADEAINAIRSASASPDGRFSGKVDVTRVFPVGHSAGGATAVALLSRPDVPSAIPLASGYLVSAAIAGNLDLDLSKPVMWIGGTRDGIVPLDDIRNGFEWTSGERRLVEIDSGHLNGFSDICAIGDGGVVARARASSLPIPEFLLQLGNDGCDSPPNVPSQELWPVVNHFVTAELRYRSGLDPEPVGLGSGVQASLPHVLRYLHNP